MSFFYEGSPIIVASSEEADAMFPNWLEVASEPLIVEAPNPLTGGTITFEKWDVKDRDKPFEPDPSAKLEFDRLPHKMLYGLTTEHLARLWQVLTDESFEDLKRILDRPVHIGRQVDWEFGLHVLPESFVALLSGLEGDSVKRVAIAWSATQDMQDDGATIELCEEILTDVQKLATQARADSKNMYYAGMI